MKFPLTAEAERACSMIVQEYMKFGLPWERMLITVRNIIETDPEETFIISVSRVNRPTKGRP
jgi:hypothetical protein